MCGCLRKKDSKSCHACLVSAPCKDPVVGDTVTDGQPADSENQDRSRAAPRAAKDSKIMPGNVGDDAEQEFEEDLWELMDTFAENAASTGDVGKLLQAYSSPYNRAPSCIRGLAIHSGLGRSRGRDGCASSSLVPRCQISLPLAAVSDSQGRRSHPQNQTALQLVGKRRDRHSGATGGGATYSNMRRTTKAITYFHNRQQGW